MAEQNEQSIIITFPSSTEAMKMDALCPPGLGRLIPLPSFIGSGCGFAWKAPLFHRETLERWMMDNHIAWREIVMDRK